MWYEINSDFIDKLKMELDPIFVDDHNVLCECNQKLEGDYNQEATALSAEELHAHCLDTESISPRGEKAVEPCDIIALKGDSVELMHNKISTRSSLLSHLFNQGVNSAMLLLQKPEAKAILDSLGRGEQVNARINED